MKKWLLKIDIKNEIQNLKKLCENFPEEYVFQGETEQLYMDLVKNLETRFCQYEDKIKDITDDDGTWESIENEIGDLMIIDDGNGNEIIFGGNNMSGGDCISNIKASLSREKKYVDALVFIKRHLTEINEYKLGHVRPAINGLINYIGDVLGE